MAIWIGDREFRRENKWILPPSNYTLPRRERGVTYSILGQSRPSCKQLNAKVVTIMTSNLCWALRKAQRNSKNKRDGICCYQSSSFGILGGEKTTNDAARSPLCLFLCEVIYSDSGRMAFSFSKHFFFHITKNDSWALPEVVNDSVYLSRGLRRSSAK